MGVVHGDAGPWTLEDVLALIEDPKRRVELMGGRRLMPFVGSGGLGGAVGASS